jgi:hypothetical protein
MAVIHIDQKLRRIPDACDRLERVAAPQKREIGDRIELKKIRAGDLEEIPDHQVVGPGRKKIREAVKNIKNAIGL